MHVLDSGTINRKSDKRQYSYHIVALDANHLSKIMALNDYIFSRLEDATMCVPLSMGEWQHVLSGNGIVLGVFVETQLIGVRTTLFPYDGEENLGRYMNFSKEQLLKVVHLETTLIHPDFRGNHLQKRMIKITLELLQTTHRYCHLFITVSPFNIASIKSVMSFNIPIVKLESMYGGCQRYIFYYDLSKSLVVDYKEKITVQNTDLMYQKDLLNQGYQGFKFIENNQNQFSIVYGKQ